MEKCEICGKEFKNIAGLKGHMLAKHPDGINEAVDKDIVKPAAISEKKEFIQAAPKKDLDFVDPSQSSVNESVDTDFVKVAKNPYRDLYPADGQVINEWCK